jgi:hypothetical protein
MGARKQIVRSTEIPQNETSMSITDNIDVFLTDLASDDNESIEDPDDGIPFADDVYIKDSDIDIPTERLDAEPTTKKRGAAPGSKRDPVSLDYELKFNLDVIQWLQRFDDSDDHPTNEDLEEIDGIGVNYIRRLRTAGLSLHSDLYKCLAIADHLGVDLIGEKQPGQRFCDNALFVKAPKKSS